MSIVKIAQTLEAHSVPYYIENNRIFADSMICGTQMFDEVVDLTDYTCSKLFAWLGY